MRLLATTNRGFESVSAGEVRELLGADVTVERPGLLGFDGDGTDLARLHCRARTLNRVLVELANGPIETPDDAYDHTRAVPLAEFVAPDQPIAVRSERIGEHPFGSPDVAERVGQAVVDGLRAATGERVPVDLDDPEVVFRATVREDRFRLSIDATGETSLHRRPYRVRDHEAPLRPTMAAAMCRLAGVGPDTAVLDPMCGCGTIPVEAALAAGNRSPTADREFALADLRFLDDGVLERERAAVESRAITAPIRGRDAETRWVEATRENAREAGVADAVTVERADATTAAIDTDAVIVDLPFGVRTEQEGLGTLYEGFFETLRAGSWDRLVALTARADLVPVEPTRRLAVRHGRLEVDVLVVDRDDVDG